MFLEGEIYVKLTEKKDTIQTRFKNGLRMKYKVLKIPPKCSAAESANK
ncbi:MAG: hypothetical protein QW146_05740 [Candidatus Bathyarchaeia archaeon]